MIHRPSKYASVYLKSSEAILYRQTSHQRPVSQGATVSNSELHRGTNIRLPYVEGET